MRDIVSWCLAFCFAVLLFSECSAQKNRVRSDEDEPEWMRESKREPRRRDEWRDRSWRETVTAKHHKHSYYDETGLRHTESPLGIPLPLDNLLEQITTHLADDPGNSPEDCVSGSSLLELDMCLTPDQKRMFDPISQLPPVAGRRRRRQASANGFSLWKNGVIPYIFNATFPAKDRNAIMGAMSEWEKTTCIRFRPANMEDRDVVIFRNGRRCSTNIGRIGREQAITLAKTCRSKRILIHELGHVIGLIHEHQRHDRDKYVKVLLGNVRNMSQERYQFSKLLSGSITDRSVKYDYTSVMHYGKNYFARRPDLTTLQTSDSRYQDVIGRAEKPSFRDVETVNRLYRCSASCPRSLHCGDTCFMDNACVCHCPGGIDKAVFNGPGAYRNQLPDATCEFFALRGECSGNIKDTVRPMCAKACGLHQLKSYTAPAETAGTISNQLQPKTALGSSWSRPPPESVVVNTVNTVNNDVNLNPLQNPVQGQGQSPPMQQGGGQFSPNPTYNLAGSSQGPPQSEVAPVSPPSPLTPVQNFRAALLQRQAALSSSEPTQYGRRLVVGRNSNGRARFMLPSQFNSRSLQRTVYTPRLNNYLQRDNYKSPQIRSGSNYDHHFGRYSSNGVSSWQPRSNNQQSLTRSNNQQSYSRQQSQTLRPRTSTRQNRQFGGNAYDRSNFGAPSRSNVNNGGSDGWLRNGLQNGGFTGGNRNNRYQQNNNGGSNAWQKGYGSNVRSQNPTTFTDFTNPEFGQIDKNLQRTGPSFMKSASPTQGYRYGQQRPFGSHVDQSRGSIWDQVQQTGPDRQSVAPQRRQQNFEPKRPSGSSGFQSQTGMWNSRNRGTQSFNNNEPYLDTLSFSNNQPGASIDQISFSDPMAAGPRQRSSQSSRRSPSRFENINRHQAFTDPNRGGSAAKRDFNINRIMAYTDPNPGGSANIPTEPKSVSVNKIQMSDIFMSQHPPPPPPPPLRALPLNTVDYIIGDRLIHSNDLGSLLGFGRRYAVYSNPSQSMSFGYTDRSSSSPSSSSSSSSIPISSDINRTMAFSSHK